MSMSSTPPLLPLNNNIINNSEEETHDPSSSSSPFQNLKPSILVIVLIVSITFLLSISLCLLLRHLNRRCLRHLSSSSNPTTTTTISSSTSTSTSTIRVSPETPPALISIIDSLPLFTFSSIKRRSTNSSGDCAVCLSKFEPQDQLRLLPMCCHAFHVHCIDTWLHSNQTCPLCRSPIHPSESDLLLKSRLSTTDDDDGLGAESFRLEIGSISRRQTSDQSRTSYSVGSFEYVVEEDSEVTTSMHRRSVSDKEIGGGQGQADQECSNLASAAGGGGGGRSSWLKDYVDRLSTSLSLSISSRALSFRSSGRFFTGSSRRSEIPSLGDYDVEANRVGEEISEIFRWFSGV